MTDNDHNLLLQAQAAKDHQEVDQLIPRADSEKTADVIRRRSRYLYHREEVAAGCH